MGYGTWDGRRCRRSWFGWHQWRRLDSGLPGALYDIFQYVICRRCRMTRPIGYKEPIHV